MKKFITALFVASTIAQSSSTSLDCHFELTPWDDVNAIYTCQVQNPQIFTSSFLHVDNVNGEHQHGMTNADVSGFQVKNSTELTHFPLGIEKLFENLTAIEISGTGLREIREDHLRHMQKLKILRLNSNHLATIDRGLLRHNTQLQEILLNDNGIYNIDPFVFSDLQNLEKLSLADNNCSRSLSSANGDHVKALVHQIEASQCSSLYDEFVKLKGTVVSSMEELQVRVGQHQLMTYVLIACVVFVAIVVSIIIAVVTFKL